MENVEKCDAIVIFPFFPQRFPHGKNRILGVITDKIMRVAGGYVAMFLMAVSQPILAKKLANLLNGGKTDRHW